MVYTYTPTYYSSLHDSITSICKTILPFSFKKRRLTGLSSEQKLSKRQSENLKWQQDSFHNILKLIGLQKEGIVSEGEVSAFRSQLLDNLIASPATQEQPTVLRDKLLFLQELLYAKCISPEDYHASKRPLLQRLAVQGAEIEARDVIVAGTKEDSEEEWSDIDFKDEQCLVNKENLDSKKKSKHGSSFKQIKGAASVISFISPYKAGKSSRKKEKGESVFTILGPVDPNIPSTNSITNESGSFKENPFWNIPSREKKESEIVETQSILMPESFLPDTNNSKKKSFHTLVQREQREKENGVDYAPKPEEAAVKSVKKQWGFDGLKKWKKSNWWDETAPLSVGERSDNRYSLTPLRLDDSLIGEGPDTQLIKNKMHSEGSASKFSTDKALGDNIKKELSRIQTELCTSNPNHQFSNDQIEAISTTLPVDKADLKKFFPKSWCDRHGDTVLDVVKKEFKDHVGEMESSHSAAKEKYNSSASWVTFEDEENCHPNQSSSSKQWRNPSASECDYYKYNTADCFQNNPFAHDCSDREDKLRTESAFFQNQNLSRIPRRDSSVMG